MLAFDTPVAQHFSAIDIVVGVHLVGMVIQVILTVQDTPPAD